MKLTIEIPKEVKQVFDNAESNNLKGGFYDYGGIIGRAIQNGIPLDEYKAENRPKGEWDINCQGIAFCSKCKKVFNHNYDIDYMEKVTLTSALIAEQTREIKINVDIC